MLIRVTRYYRALTRLRAIGLEKVFAHNLADAAGVSAAIVRKDFSLLEIHGQKRDLIIVGGGRIGKALMNYTGVEGDGIRTVAGFDSDPVVYSDASNPIPIYPLSRLEEVIRVHKVKAAIITVPEASAQECYMHLLECGITGVLNFSPITLKPMATPSGVHPVVHNINIGLELEQIFYELKFPKEEKR